MRAFLLPLLATLAVPAALAQDTNCDSELTSQAEVDALDCTSISELTIRGNDIQNLEGLSELAHIGGNFDIRGNAALTSLAGLDALTAVDGELRIILNDALTSLAGLDAITSVAGILYIRDNAALTSLVGLDAITSIDAYSGSLNPGTLAIVGNAALTSLAGLDALTSVAGHLVIRDNAALMNVDDLSALRSIGANFYLDGIIIQSNPLLERCAVGFGPILAADQSLPSTISGRITLQGNAPEGDCNSVQSILDSYALSTEDDLILTAAPLAVYPNPAVARATFTFVMAEAEKATLVVYDALGREVARLLDGPTHGSEEITLDAGALPAGLYVARLVAGDRVETARLTVLR
jgi:hypothetical protein